MSHFLSLIKLEAEFKEFESRLKFQDLSRRSIETGFLMQTRSKTENFQIAF